VKLNLHLSVICCDHHTFFRSHQVTLPVQVLRLHRNYYHYYYQLLSFRHLCSQRATLFEVEEKCDKTVQTFLELLFFSFLVIYCQRHCLLYKASKPCTSIIHSLFCSACYRGNIKFFSYTGCVI